MRFGRISAGIAALSLGVSACTGSADEATGSPVDPVVVSDNDSDDPSDPVVAQEPDLGSDPARCIVIPQVTPIGGVDVLVTNVGQERQAIDIYRDGELQATVSPEPGGVDPKQSLNNDRFDQTAYHTDLDSPLGATSRYTATTGEDPLGGDVCGVIDVPELWPTPVCSVSVIDGFPHLILEDGFGSRTYVRNGEPFTISSPAGVGSARLFDAEPPAGIPLRYTITSVNGRWPDTSSDCGTVTIDTAPPVQGLLEQAETRLLGTLGPFWYTTVEPICADCEPNLWFTYAFRHDGTILGTWRNGFETDPSAEPWRIPPQQLATHLLAQRAAGKTVEIDFVGATTTIASWTVDGIGAQVRCASVDTAPLSRRTPFCDPEFFD